MGSRPSKVSPSKLNLQSSVLREDSTLLNSQYFPPKSPIMSIVSRATSHDRLHENGFVTPRSRGRSAIYSMARTPYSRVYPISTLKVCIFLINMLDCYVNHDQKFLFGSSKSRVLGFQLKVGRHLQLSLRWIMTCFLDLEKG